MPSQIPPSGIRELPTRVLVVDDDFDSAEVLGVILAEKDYDVRIGLSAKEALAIVEDFTPHVALVDIGLPSTTGYELLAALRANAALSACRYVAVTGYDAKDLAQRSVNAGFDEHLVKPVAISTLLAAITGSNLSDAESG